MNTTKKAESSANSKFSGNKGYFYLALVFIATPAVAIKLVSTFPAFFNNQSPSVPLQTIGSLAIYIFLIPLIIGLLLGRQRPGARTITILIIVLFALASSFLTADPDTLQFANDFSILQWLKQLGWFNQPGLLVDFVTVGRILVFLTFICNAYVTEKIRDVAREDESPIWPPLATGIALVVILCDGAGGANQILSGNSVLVTTLGNLGSINTFAPTLDQWVTALYVLAYIATIILFGILFSKAQRSTSSQQVSFLEPTRPVTQQRFR